MAKYIYDSIYKVARHYEHVIYTDEDSSVKRNKMGEEYKSRGRIK